MAGDKPSHPKQVRGEPKTSVRPPTPNRDTSPIPPSPNEGRLGPAGDPAEGKRD